VRRTGVFGVHKRMRLQVDCWGWGFSRRMALGFLGSREVVRLELACRSWTFGSFGQRSLCKSVLRVLVPLGR